MSDPERLNCGSHPVPRLVLTMNACHAITVTITAKEEDSNHANDFHSQ
jgi:hypothetical protein